ncbi:MAG: N-acetylmuramoyl-L-alanine amidase, partial [Thermoplasmata archaeon]
MWEKFGVGFSLFLLFSALNVQALPCSEICQPDSRPVWKIANYTVYGFLPYWTSTSYSPEWAVLSHVAWFGESLSSTGTVSSSHPLPSGLVSTAHSHGVKVPLTITCFNSTSIDSVLANYMDTAVNNILARVQDYGCDGVSIDFEGVHSTNTINGQSNKLLLQNFMEKLYTKFKTTNPDYHVSICAPAVDWSNVFRNANLTNCLDAFLIMGYDYFWSGSTTTGPVAPLEGYTYDLTYTVNTYLNYLPANKIVLLLPFYGFDWPCVGDSAGATTSGTGTAVLMKTAMANAQTYGRRWHNASSTPWYAYQSGGVWHQCWYDDTESLEIKFKLVLQRQLQGTGMWALGYEDRSIWQVISQLFGGTLSLNGKKIAIDPGHGGSDPGATGIDGSVFPNEEDFTLDIALRVKELLAFAGATVILTRASDTDVSLQQRCDIANNANADIFVSIHMNSAGETAKGTETFYYANSETDYSVEGKRLAQNVQGRIVSRLGTYERGIKGDFPYFGYHLYVLAHTNMPAILTEVCFISNATDFGIISQSDMRTLVALGIYEGICGYFGVTPVYSSASLNITFPSDKSSVTGTVKFSMSYGNQNLLTGCRWRIGSGNWSSAYTREWFFNAAQQTQVSFNTYSYSVGWKNLTFELSDLWGNKKIQGWQLFFTRNLAFEGVVWGSGSASNLTDDNDDNYAANNLGVPLYIALKCNHTIRAVKIHWWDGDTRYYQYRIEISRDNETWVEIVNKTTGEYRSWQWDQIDAVARYIRITGTYNSANQWYHIKEMQILGRM